MVYFWGPMSHPGISLEDLRIGHREGKRGKEEKSKLEWEKGQREAVMEGEEGRNSQLWQLQPPAVCSCL